MTINARQTRTLAADGEKSARMQQTRVDAAVEHLRAEVASMRRSRDFVRVILSLGKKLSALGLDFGTCAINLLDEGENRVRAYTTGAMAFSEVLLKAYRVIPFGDDAMEHLDQEEGPLTIADIPDGEGRFVGYLCTDAETYYGRYPRAEETVVISRSDQELEAMVPKWEKIWRADPWPEEGYFRSSLRAPFQGGVIALNDARAGHFSQEDAWILERFAEAFSLGYARYLDFRRLESRNRELQIGRAVAQIQTAVQAMNSSADFVRVILSLGEELSELGLEFVTCAINVFDEPAHRIKTYITGAEKFWENKPPNYKFIPFGPDAIERLEQEGGPLTISDVSEGEWGIVSYVSIDPEDYHGRYPTADETVIISRTEAEVEEIVPQWERIWNTVPWPERGYLRSSLRSPFKGGVIALNHNRARHYSQQDAWILERFAEAFSLGYARHLDFRSLEKRNRELRVDEAVGRVQNAVAAMRTSADIVLIITLITQELEALGLEFLFCSISVIDETRGKVRSFTTPQPEIARFHPDFSSRNSEILPFGPDTLDRIEREEDLAWVSAIPGAEDRVASVVTIDAEEYRLRYPDRETAIQSRSEEEAREMVRLYEKRYRIHPWPEEWVARSSLRCPFEGGAISLVHAKRDHFNESHARILERFAEAFSLGYARFQDFRRLEEQNRTLEAANRLKSEFLANMSHEIRTPMNAVINFSSLILDGSYGEINEDLRDAVEEIDRNGVALLSLINDILDLAKIEAGAMKLKVTECEPEALLQTALSGLEYEAEEKGLALRLTIEEGLPNLEVDERRLTQHVLVNLLENAIKFTAEGEIRVGVRRKDGEIQFWVTDTGIGISREEQENIFESFRQVDGSVTRVAQGSGLGLTIARKFVEMHGGRIWVESELGQGATFCFTIPVHR